MLSQVEIQHGSLFGGLGKFWEKSYFWKNSGQKTEQADKYAADSNPDMEFCGNEIEPELEDLDHNSFEERMNDLNEVLKNHESRLDQMDFIQNELKRIDTIISVRVTRTRFNA